MTTMTTKTLDGLVLSKGRHDTPEEGMCLVEAAAWWNGEPFSDHPECVCPVLGVFGRSWNDGMRSDAERDQLKPYVPLLVGTAGDSEDSSRRSWMALDWSVRVSTPAWLDLAGMADHAQRLRDCPEIIDSVPDGTTAALRDARSAAGAAAWDAAEAAAWDAAEAAAWDAARAAAVAAAGAAAWDAAWDSLEPTTMDLQASAHVLFRRMIAAGPHDAVAFAAA